MKTLVKILMSVLTKIALAACGEAVVEYIIFKALEMAVDHTDSHVDNELMAKIKAAYNQNKTDSIT
jgi:hypothetical protein